MRKCFLVFGLFVFANLLLAPGIVFEQGTIQEVFAKAKAQNKPIFIDVYTTWCGPCKWMSKEVFTKESVGQAYNPLFVSYKMDAEADENQLLSSSLTRRLILQFCFSVNRVVSSTPKMF